jgi:NADH-quinone oxidoreductase subunit M
LSIVLWNYYSAEPGAPQRLTFSIPALAEGLQKHPIDPRTQVYIFLALFAGFAIKVPLFPLHTWLPLCMPWILWLAVAGIIYGALVALAQSDMKRLIAYSSVSHLGFCMLGMFALNDLGVKGGVLQMVNHGISTGGLFALVGMIYERYHTREISQLGGLARRTPWLAAFMLIFTLASIGLPGTNGFVGEFLILLGMFQRGWADAPDVWAVQWKVISVVAVLGVVLGAWYMLWLVERVFFGPLRETVHKPDEPPVADLKPREILALSPLVVFIFWIGLQPQYFLERMNPELEDVATVVSDAFDREYGLPLPDAKAADATEGTSPMIDHRVDVSQRESGRLLESSPFSEGGIARVR